MELLIFSKEHWMNKLTEDDIKKYEEKYPNFREKYERRYRKGDIIEVREDGYFDKHGFNKKAFVVLKVPNVKEVSKLMEEHQDRTDPENPKVLKRRKYQVNNTYLVNKISYVAKEGIENDISKIPVYDKERESTITLDKVVK